MHVYTLYIIHSHRVTCIIFVICIVYNIYDIICYVADSCGLCVYMQEIIQNADDAGARRVTFYLDKRIHGTQSLIVSGLEQFQGPALLAFNDAKFTTKDWENIQKPEQSGKEKDPFKVGKFGLGFNSVYHITGELIGQLHVHISVYILL